MKEKIIRDLVHGYISIDHNIEKIIDHPSFQRLKGIAQLTAHHLYPSANHTRFEHSLGVMHLSELFWRQIEKDISFKDKEITKEKALLNLKIAALLHDVGHGPFSHLGEHFFVEEEIRQNIKVIDEDISKALSNGLKHELMSCAILLKVFKPVLDAIEEFNGKLEYDLICRIITGNRYDTTQKWIENILIEIVNSGSVDVDKLDYLMRDNIMCGHVAPRIDFERLVLSLKIDAEKKLSFKPIGISSLISLKDSRDFLYLWVYNHHTVVYTDFLYREMVRHLGNEDNVATKPDNKIDIKALFSFGGIEKKYLSDKDIGYYFNREYVSTESAFSKKLLKQLIERDFLKPLWKTIYEYSLFMRDNFHDDRVRMRVEDDINDDKDNDKNIKNIVKEIIKDIGCENGDVFLIKRSNKFYSMSKKLEFFINFAGRGDVSLDNIFPERDFKENYSEIAFYLFTKEEYKESVRKSFITIMMEKRYLRET